ncbi:hypothetical protein BH11PSE7_BH11PSE7_16710 [soil metagenome]
MPARAVAYDLASGFGLIKPLVNLRGVAAVPVGSMKDLQPGDVVLAVDGVTAATLESFYKKWWARAEPDIEVRLSVLQGVGIRNIWLKGVDRMTTMQKPAGI